MGWTYGSRTLPPWRVGEFCPDKSRHAQDVGVSVVELVAAVDAAEEEAWGVSVSCALPLKP